MNNTTTPALATYTALAIIELGEIITSLGHLVQSEDPARRGALAIGLERAAAHVRGENYDPPNERLRLLRVAAPRLVDLVEDVTAWSISGPDGYTEAMESLRLAIQPFLPDRKGS